MKNERKQKIFFKKQKCKNNKSGGDDNGKQFMILIFTLLFKGSIYLEFSLLILTFILKEVKILF